MGLGRINAQPGLWVAVRLEGQWSAPLRVEEQELRWVHLQEALVAPQRRS